MNQAIVKNQDQKTVEPFYQCSEIKSDPKVKCYGVVTDVSFKIVEECFCCPSLVIRGESFNPSRVHKNAFDFYNPKGTAEQMTLFYAIREGLGIE